MVIIKTLYRAGKKTLWTIVLVIISIIFVGILPGLIIPFLPIFLYRFIIFKIAPIFRPDLGKMLSARGQIYASDNLDTDPNCTLLGVITVEEILDIDRVRQCVMERVILHKNADGQVARPEMSQFITDWAGFKFWKNDPTFDIKNHVKYFDRSEPVYDDEFVQIEKEVIKMNHVKLRSPWEVYILKDLRRKGDPTPEIRKSVIIIKIHHSLGDGFSIAKMLVHAADFTAKCQIPDPGGPKKNIFMRMAFGIIFMIKAPYDFVHTLFSALDVNDYHLPEKKMTKKIQTSVTQRIPMSLLKEIKALHGVTVTSVILGAIAGAIRNHMIKAGVKLPHKISCGTALPVPGHPDKMRNHTTACFVGLPVGVPDPRKRLKIVNRNLRAMRTSTLPVTLFWLWTAVGSLFSVMVKAFGKNSISTSILSNFPGPTQPMNFIGHPVTDMYFGSGLLAGNTAIIVAVVSYDGAIKIATTSDKAVIPNDASAHLLRDLIIEELEVLKNYGNAAAVPLLAV